MIDVYMPLSRPDWMFLEGKNCLLDFCESEPNSEFDIEHVLKIAYRFNKLINEQKFGCS